jgi:hypothetical protein
MIFNFNFNPLVKILLVITFVSVFLKVTGVFNYSWFDAMIPAMILVGCELYIFILVFFFLRK